MRETALLNVHMVKKKKDDESTTMFREHRKINVKLLYNLAAFYVNDKSTRTHQEYHDSHGVLFQLGRSSVKFHP